MSSREPGYVDIPIREWRAEDCPVPSAEVVDRLRRLLPPVPINEDAVAMERAA